MKLIGAGFGRTGTASLKLALESIGYGPCYHMFEVGQHPEHAALWEQAARGEEVDWEEVLGEYQSAVDWPAAAFWNRLLARYPDAKVLLTVRDPDSWYESAMSTIYPRTSRTVEDAPAEERERHRMIRAVIWEGTFAGEFENKERALEIYQRHIEDVKARVPAERLLVYDVRDGWEPLCRFLDVPVPPEPFPRVNDRVSFQERMRVPRDEGQQT